MIKWQKLPDELKNDEVRKYYDMLCNKKLSLILKRTFDICLSFVLIIVLLPLFVILSIFIKMDSKGKVFYMQERITKYGRKFRIFKFRTMVSNADKIGTLITIENDSRITRVGNKLRKTRLDEIPQIINVLIGDMSFVGTRPEVERYIKEYTNEMKATLLMPAGITSIASINFKDEDEIIDSFLKDGREVDDIYIKEILPIKMKYNLEYIKDFSFIEDIKICINTVVEVFK